MLKEQIIKDLENVLSPKRLAHSIGTMEMCKKLALKLNVDVQKAELCGLAHDIAKEFSKEEIYNYIKENELELDEMELANLKLAHAKLGSDIVKKKYNFDDEMCTAIKYHTTGKANMSLLTKIVFISDLIEENRTFNDVQYLRELTFEDIDKGIIYALELQIKKCLEKGTLLHNDTINARNYLIKQNL